MGRNVVVLNHLVNLQWAQLLGCSWLWGEREEKRREKIKTGCKTEYIVTVGQNVPWPTTRSLWTFWCLHKNGCDWLSLSAAITSYSYRVVKSHQAEERACNTREELSSVETISDACKGHQTQQQGLWAGPSCLFWRRPFSVSVSSSSYCRSYWFQSNSKSLSDAC